MVDLVKKTTSNRAEYYQIGFEIALCFAILNFVSIFGAVVKRLTQLFAEQSFRGSSPLRASALTEKISRKKEELWQIRKQPLGNMSGQM